MIRMTSVEKHKLPHEIEDIRKTANEIIAIVPALIIEGIVIKYLIIYGN